MPWHEEGALTLNQRLLSGARLDLEGPHLDVVLDGGVAELAANEALGIEDGVGGVHGHLVLGGITNQALAVGEGDIRGRSTVALVVGNDLHAVILPDTHAAAEEERIIEQTVSGLVFKCCPVRGRGKLPCLETLRVREGSTVIRLSLWHAVQRGPTGPQYLGQKTRPRRQERARQ